MSQLAQLIQQAKNQRGLDDLFKTGVSEAVTRSEPVDKSASESLMSSLEELEVQLFPCLDLSSSNRDEIIKTLESVMDDL